MIEKYPGLNYKDNDEKFILLGKVFETIEKKNSKEILRAGDIEILPDSVL